MEKQQTKNLQKNGVDVPPNMSVTFAVFHFERSELNAIAFENAVKVYQSRGPNPKVGRTKKKKWCE